MEEKFFEGRVRIPSGCAISGFIHRDGGMSDGGAIIASIATMRERSCIFSIRTRSSRGNAKVFSKRGSTSSTSPRYP